MEDVFYGFGEDDDEDSEGVQVLKCGPKNIKLLHNGFQYHKDKQAENKFYWQCVQRREQAKENKCPGRARTEVGANGKHTLLSATEHNHPPDPLATNSSRYRAALKRKANEGTEKPEKIMRISAPQFPVEVQATFSKTAQRRVCQRQRGSARLPTDPINYDDLQDSFTKTLDGRNFVMANSVKEDKRIIMFGTVEDLTRLSQSEVVVLDGTFSMAPKGFRQIFTVHGSIGRGMGRKFAPFVHFLLPDKAEPTYKRALKILTKKCWDNKINLDPDIILTDFESAEMNAVRHVFPDTALYGCFFHLTKSWWKRMQKYGLTGKYAKNVNIQMAFKQTQALAFLDPEDVPEGFAAIRKNAPKSMKPFFDYVSDYYVLGKLKKNDPTRRSKPRFPPELWSMKANLINGIPRTSNAIEGYHNKLNGQLKGNIIQFYAVTRFFQQEEVSTSAEYLRYLQGDMLEDRRSKKLKKKDERLKKLVESRTTEEFEIFGHLQGLGLALMSSE